MAMVQNLANKKRKETMYVLGECEAMHKKQSWVFNKHNTM
jgi:hypothetical protein